VKQFTPYIIVLVFILAACAQQVAPTGGPKDKEPPKIIKSEPENFTVSFTGNRVYLKFDEYVQQNNLYSTLLISPSFKEEPDIKVRPKEVEIIFKEALQANTTYTINFGEGITDITEKNPLDSNLFVFSTGPYLDSLTLTGSIRDAFTLKPEKDMYMMLYREAQDSIPMKQRPDYLAKVDELGNYKIEYVKEGKYKAFALNDKSADYIFNLPNERIGFADELIDLSTIDTLDLKAFEEEAGTQYLEKVDARTYGRIYFKFGKPTTDPQAFVQGFSTKKAWYLREVFTNKDTLCYWLMDMDGVDSLKFIISDGSVTLDTVKVALSSMEDMNKVKNRRRKGGGKLKLTQTNSIRKNKLDIFKPLRIRWAHPIREYDLAKAMLVEAGDTLPVLIKTSDPVKRRFEIEHIWKPETDYRLFIPSGIFKDYLGLVNDTIDLKFRTTKSEDYGKLNLKVIPPSTGQYILQLMEKEKVLQEDLIGGTKTINYENLIPRSYSFKLIFDGNSDGKWTTGNYLKHIQPEKVIYYSGKRVQIKAGWEQDLEWTIPE